jgi:hypothetical protein
MKFITAGIITEFASTYICEQLFSFLNFRIQIFLFKVNRSVSAPATKDCSNELRGEYRQTFRRQYYAKVTVNQCAFLVFVKLEIEMLEKYALF